MVAPRAFIGHFCRYAFAIVTNLYAVKAVLSVLVDVRRKRDNVVRGDVPCTTSTLVWLEKGAFPTEHAASSYVRCGMDGVGLLVLLVTGVLRASVVSVFLVVLLGASLQTALLFVVVAFFNIDFFDLYLLAALGDIDIDSGSGLSGRVSGKQHAR